MGRDIKKGLSYFPLDVDFFEDDKLRFVEARFNEKGELIAIKLLCKIFKAGYFVKWDDDISLLFSSTAGKNISPGLANEVVNELVKRDFFNKDLFERFSILTSTGIQKRYVKICTDSKRKDWNISKDFYLLRIKSAFTPEEMPKTPEESTQSKEKESKEKERREENPLKDSNLFRSPKIPGKEEVHRVFLSNGGSEEMAEKFFKKYDSVGWYLHGSPITNFSSLVFTFIENWNKNLKKDGSSKVVKNNSAGAEKLLERLRSASA